MKGKGVSYGSRLAVGVLAIMLLISAVARVNAQEPDDAAAAINQESSGDLSANVPTEPNSFSEEEGAPETPQSESQEATAPPESTSAPSTTDDGGETPMPEKTPEPPATTDGVAESDGTPMPEETPEPPTTTDGSAESDKTPAPEETPEPPTTTDGGAESGNTPMPGDTPEPHGTPSPYPETDVPDESATPDAATTPEVSASPTVEPTALPSPSPAGVIAVVIEFENVTIIAGDTEFDLMDGVTAHDQDGKPVEVIILSDDDFNVNIPGTYQVEYGAKQGEDTIVRMRAVQVFAEEETGEEPLQEDVPQVDPSSALYQQRRRQRSSIHSRLSEEMGEIEIRLFQGLQGLQLQTDPSLGKLDWNSVLAYYIAKSNLPVDQPLDLLEMDPAGLDELDSVVAAVLLATITEREGERAVSVGIRSAEESAVNLGLSQPQANTAQTLMQPQYKKVLAALLGDTSYNDLTKEQAEAILAELPAGVSSRRQAVVLQAQTLLGDVSYKWGGKYNQVGWNPDWGIAQKKDAGLDCSGFVSWTFINAFHDQSVLPQVGNGSCNQWSGSDLVAWEEAKVGDLLFIAVPGTREINHVGILADIEPDGTYLAIHCSARHGVVLTEAWESGFRYIRRPRVYGE